MAKYEVIRKYSPIVGGHEPPGEHYDLENPNAIGGIWFREGHFYRTPGGREVAFDGLGERLAPDDDIARAIKQAVDEYDAKEQEES